MLYAFIIMVMMKKCSFLEFERAGNTLNGENFFLLRFEVPELPRALLMELRR